MKVLECELRQEKLLTPIREGARARLLGLIIRSGSEIVHGDRNEYGYRAVKSNDHYEMP